MEILNEIIDGYGIAAPVLLLLVVVLFVEQVVSLCRMLIVAKFKQTTRTQILQEQPPVSVVVPLFGEDEEYLKRFSHAALSELPNIRGCCGICGQGGCLLRNP